MKTATRVLSIAPLLALAALATLSTPGLAQTTWFVDGSGSPPGTGTVGDPYTSILYAIGQGTTVDGDTVLVAPGTYNEGIAFGGKAIEVRSSGGPEVTTLDATGVFPNSAAIFIAGEGAGSQLIGMRLTGGIGFEVAGVRAGGGLFISGASPTIRDCIIEGNEAEMGGGAFLSASSATFQNCTFEDNWARLPLVGGGYDWTTGGAVHCESAASPDFDGCTFKSNVANRGGGLYGHGSNVSLVDCEFAENEARGSSSYQSSGGGIHVTSAGHLTMQDCTIRANVAKDSARSDGGGVMLAQSSAFITGTDFIGNSASEDCMFDLGSGGGMRSACGSFATLVDCHFEGNESCFRGGGFAGAGNISYSTFVDNWSVDGGGLHASNCELTITDSEIIGNWAWHGTPSEWFGGGLHGPATATRCLFQGNIASNGAGARRADLIDCDVRDNYAYDAGGYMGAHGAGLAECTAIGCDIRFNRCSDFSATREESTGGGAYLGTLQDCYLNGNAAHMGGGAHAAQLVGCTLVENTADYGAGIAEGEAQRSSFVSNRANYGGGAFATDLVHCSLTSNSALLAGGGLYAEPGANSVVSHTIIWGNLPSEIHLDGPSDVAAEWSDVMGGWPGIGNFVGDPLFANATGADLRLSAGSPCIDAGNPTGPWDPDGSIADVGAFVFNPAELPSPGSFCAPKQTSEGLFPFVSFEGLPTLSGPDDFRIQATDARGGQSGIMFWGLGPQDLPFLGGKLCVQGPLIRSTVMTSSVEGRFDYPFVQAIFAQYGVPVGQLVCGQFWFRDPGHPDGTHVGLSDGLAFIVRP